MSAAQETVERMCQLPAEFRRRGDVSMKTLVRESGFIEHKFDIEPQAILRFVQTHPQVIDDWSAYSADKRASSGWYFDLAALQVGLYTSGKRDAGKIFEGAAEACAVFIAVEIPWILYYDHVA